jgi:hypothetical protein
VSKKVHGQSSSFSYFRTEIPSSQYSPTHQQRGIVVAASAAANAVVAVLSGYRRLVARLACLSASQQWKRGHRDGVLGPEALYCLIVQTAIRRRLIVARDLSIDSAPILAGRRTDPDAVVGPYYQSLLLILAG